MDMDLNQLKKNLNWNQRKSEKRNQEMEALLQLFNERGRSGATVQLTQLDGSLEREFQIPYTFLGEGDLLTPNKLMREYKVLPAHGLTIKYICDYIDAFISDDVRNQLITDITNEIVTKSKPSGQLHTLSKSEQALHEIVLGVAERLKENGVPKKVEVEENGKVREKNYGLPYIRKSILNMKEEDFLTVFAPALEFSYEDVEAYLLRVFRRVGLNANSYKEVLLYIALQNMNCKGSVYSVFTELCKYYEELSKTIELSPKGDELEEDFLYLTEEVIAAIEASGELFQGETCTEETIHPLLKELLIEHCKCVVKDFDKTRKEVFDDLWKEVPLLYANEVYEYQSFNSNKKENVNMRGELHYRTPSLKITACKEELILDPVSSTPGYIKRAQRNSLSDVEDGSVATENEKKIEKDKSNTKGDKQNWAIRTPITGRLMHKNNESPILAFTNIDYDGKPGEYGKATGKIQIKCYVGTYIPKGTIFEFYDSKRMKCFYYETDKDYSSVPTDTFCTYLYEAKDEWISAGESEEEIAEREECRQLIDTTLFHGWLDKAEITNLKVRSFEKKTAEEKRNYILTLLFLHFIKQTKHNSFNKREIRSKFIKEANPVLRKCGFAKVHNMNQFDLLLLYILGMRNPLDAFREIWVYYAVSKEND